MTRTASNEPAAVATVARPLATSWLLQFSAFALASAFVSLTLRQQASSLAPSGAVVLLTAVPTFLAPLFRSGQRDLRKEIAGSMLSWACVVLLLASVGWSVLGVRFAFAPFAMASLVALGIVAVTHQSIALLEAALRHTGVTGTSAREGALWTIAVILWLAASTPLWLGPVADLSARQVPMVPTITLACSPLAHLAAAAGNDVLRGEWFYGHSSLGSLQVDYPRVGSLLIAYALLAAALGLLLAIVRRRARSRAETE